VTCLVRAALVRLGSVLVVASIAASGLVGAQPVAAVAGFGDVEDARFFTAGVQWMVDNDITQGTSATCFSPHDPVTRGQAVTFLWRMEEEPPAPAHSFGDVVKAWQQGPVSWAAAAGITEGTSETLFSPDRALTRGEFATLLFRLEGEPEGSFDHSFTDVARSWQQAPVAWLSSESITFGVTPTTFAPERAVTRGELATFLYRYKDQQPVSVDPTHPRAPRCAGQVPNPGASSGYNSLFIGHSFFIPIARDLPNYARTAGLVDHQQETVFSGGGSGAPQALWENEARRAEAQAVLDGGDIELFGMTYHPDYPSLEGYRNWISYAVDRNPDVIIFIGVPWQTNPTLVSGESFAQTWRGLHVAIGHDLLDALRLEFPNTEFFDIPYGQGAGELYTRFDAGQLPDVPQLVQGPGGGLFGDSFGHAGPILRTLSVLVWLRAIYDVPLASFPDDTRYVTDLRAIADSILDDHDPAYSLP